MPGPEEIRQEMDAILLAKQGLESAEEAHKRLDGLSNRVDEIADSHVVINSKLDRLISVLPDLIIMVKDRRGRAWLSARIIEYGKVAAGLTAAAGLVYGMLRVGAGLLP